ncbi:TatD family hydrolase [Candidatus Sumerlaeota bacterium]|nr:TatD family hydrolase [Candidatus Sumerlaeota bacterium]
MTEPAWIDSHCHLTDEAFAADLDETIERARAAGVGHIVAVGDNVESSRAALDLVQRHAGVLSATVGVHPHRASEWSPDALDALRRLCAGRPRPVAIGEIGLDHFYNFASREDQMRAFVEQSDLARELGLPMAIHCRDAYDPLIQLAEERALGAVGGVVHCFTGSAAQAVALAELGFSIGIAGVLTFKKSETIREAVRAVPIESLVIETDAPYLAPVPHRGHRNEPAFLAHTAERLALELGIDARALSSQLARNTKRLFRLDGLDFRK